MQLSSIFDASDQDRIYSVSLEPGFFVDVKVCPETNLIYIMQNGDGSTVYGADGTDSTFPDYSYNEADVISFVIDAHNKILDLGEPLIYDSIFSNRLGERKDLAGLVDVLSPQESADLFGKPVRADQQLFLPAKENVREDRQQGRRASLADQIDSALQKLQAQTPADAVIKGIGR